ncbi:MAG: hypothetical protein J6T10_00870 [Methanobrevibacter sp.]|nr:hypothetical protein [Methanobrevibacter sp.]
MNIILNKDQQALYNKGEIVTGIDLDTYKVYKVTRNNEGKMCIVISTSNPYTRVNPYTQETSALNLTAEETKQAMQSGTIKVYRSSGAKDGDKVLTREEQIKRGCARVIEVCAMLKEGKNKDSVNPIDYDWHILNDNSNRLEVIK